MATMEERSPSRAVTALAIGNVGKRREAATGGHGGDGHATGGCCDVNPNQKPRSHDILANRSSLRQSCRPVARPPPDAKHRRKPPGGRLRRHSVHPHAVCVRRLSTVAKDSPVNGTAATMSTVISEPMSGWRGWCRVSRHPISGTRNCRNGSPAPLEWRFCGVGAESLRGQLPAGFAVTSRPALIRGCECRLRAARRATIARRRGHGGSARARPSRWAGRGRVKLAAVRVVRPSA